MPRSMIGDSFFGSFMGSSEYDSSDFSFYGPCLHYYESTTSIELNNHSLVECNRTIHLLSGNLPPSMSLESLSFDQCAPHTDL